MGTTGRVAMFFWGPGNRSRQPQTLLLLFTDFQSTKTFPHNIMLMRAARLVQVLQDFQGRSQKFVCFFFGGGGLKVFLVGYKTVE